MNSIELNVFFSVDRIGFSGAATVRLISFSSREIFISCIFNYNLPFSSESPIGVGISAFVDIDLFIYLGI